MPLQDNPYDKAIEALPKEEPQAESKYDAAIRAIGNGTPALSASMDAASAVDPDRYAEAVRVGGRLRVPASQVMQDFEGHKREDEFRSSRFRDLDENHPYLAEFLRNADNAAVMRDKVSVLKQLDRVFRQEAPFRPRTLTDGEIKTRVDREVEIESGRVMKQVLYDEFHPLRKGFLTPIVGGGELPSDDEVRAYVRENYKIEGRIRDREAFIGAKEEIGFGEAIGRRYSENPLAWLPYVSGVHDAQRALGLYLAAEAAEEGRETEEQREFLVDAARLDAAAQARGMSVGGMVGATLAEMPAFVGEIATTAGVYSGVRQAVLKGGEKVMEGVLRRSLQRGLANKWVARAAGAAAQTAVAAAPRLLKGTAERMTPEGTLSEDGETINYEIKPGTGDSFGVALSKSFVDQFSEVASERLGGAAFMRGLDKGVNKILFGWWASKAPGRTAQMFERFLEAGQFHGIPSEMAEERFGALIRAIGGTGEFGEIIPTGKEAAAEALAFAVPGALRAGLSRIRPQDRAQAGEMHGETLKETAQAIKESKLLERSPEKLAEFVAHEVKETGSEFKYHPLEQFKAYAESKKLDPASFAADLTGDPKAYEKAVTTGNALAIPTANWATKILGSEHEAFMQEELRADPLSMNAREANEWKQAQRAARLETEQLQKAHEEQFGPLLRELKDRGVAPVEGVKGTEFEANIPKQLRKKTGLPLDEWIGELVNRGTLPQGATQEDFYRLIQTATTTPGAVAPEATLEAVQAQPESAMGRIKEAAGKVKEAVVKGLQAVGLKEIPGLKDISEADIKRYSEVFAGHLRARAEILGIPVEELIGREVPRFALGEVAPKAALEQPAYHGSPHIFERFSLQKIGTGEGVQAYGWGLYFSGEKEVAKLYRESLSRDAPPSLEILGEYFKPGNIVPSHGGYDRVVAFHPPIEGAKYPKNYWSVDVVHVEKRGGEWVDAGEVRNHQTPPDLRAVKQVLGRDLGRLYEVDIPKDEDYLDWDLPLRRQSSKVKKALKELGLSRSEFSKPEQFPDRYELSNGTDISRDLDGNFSITVTTPSQSITKSITWSEVEKILEANTTGEVLYSILSQRQGKRTQEANAESASRLLASAGIAGIKFLDQISRKKGEGSYNYVVFDDKLIQIQAFEQPGEAGRPRGFFDPTADILALTRAADRSTMFHEPAHRWLVEIGRDVAFLKEKDPATLTDIQKRFLARSDETLKFVEAESFATITKEQHERFAQGFEKYIMEGKAPSKALRGVFWHFKKWLLSIYKEIKSLGINLTPEIRNVYDHLLATEEEVAAAREEISPSRMDAQMLGLTGQPADIYNRLVEEDLQENEEILTLKALSDIRRREKAEWKAQAQEYREEITKSVNDEPVYKVLSNLRYGTMPDGSALPEGVQPVKFDSSELKTKYPDYYKKFPFLHRKSGGTPIGLIANMYGFESEKALMDALANAELRTAKIERMVDELMRGVHGDPLTADQMLEEAKKAVHGEKRSDLLIARLRALGQKSNKRLTPIAVIRDYAEETVSKMRSGKVSADRALRAERDAARAAVEAAAKGDFEAAFNASERELLNHEIYRAATKVQERMDEAFDLFRDILSGTDEKLAKSRDVDMIHAARAILGQFGVGSEVRFENALTYLGQLKEYDPEAYAVLESKINQATQGARRWQDTDVEKFLEMTETVEALWNLSRELKKIEIEGKLLDKEEVEKELASAINEQGRSYAGRGIDKELSKWERVVGGVLGFRAMLRRVEHWVDARDSGKIQGIFRKYLWTPVKEAATKYRLQRKVEIEKLLKNAEGIKGWLAQGGKIAAPELGPNVEFTRNRLVAAILHRGNESNLSKLLRGYKWGKRKSDGSLDTSKWDAFMRRLEEQGILTKEVYDFAQKVWDQFESLKPEAQKVHKKLYGHFFKEITAKPFLTKWGVYQGGYVPATADPELVSDAAARNKFDELTQGGNSFMFPSADESFTKSRSEGYAKPLKLDAQLLPGQFDKVLKFIHLQEPVKNVAKLVMFGEVNQALSEFDPKIVQGMFVPWLSRTVRQSVDTPTARTPFGRGLERVARELRRRVGQDAMILNVANALQQTTGLSVAATKVSPTKLAAGFVKFFKNPADAIREIVERSEFMGTIHDTSMIESNNAVRDILLNPNILQKTGQFFDRNAYVLQQYAQDTVNFVTWIGAYNQAMERNESEKDAVREADAIVRETQGTFAPEDMSAFEAGSPMVRLFTMFTSYFNMKANLLGTEAANIVREYGLKAGLPRLLYLYVSGLAVPAALSGIIYGLFRGGFDDDDDDGVWDEILSTFFIEQLREGAGMVPFGAPVERLIEKKIEGKRGFLQVSPVIGAIERAAEAPESVIEALGEDGKPSKAIKDFSALFTLFTGVPLRGVARPFEYAAQLSERE